jgi:hypothetical protein
LLWTTANSKLQVHMNIIAYQMPSLYKGSITPSGPTPHRHYSIFERAAMNTQWIRTTNHALKEEPSLLPLKYCCAKHCKICRVGHSDKVDMSHTIFGWQEISENSYERAFSFLSRFCDNRFCVKSKNCPFCEDNFFT